ncbi:hypothetical protein [Providencia burhodogranariea]|uniref:Uncharacterized protein n=1 Tax=Providencia burhodogranariea DSM 19968 TaxID=1141662 RepID=K8WWZ4_9GAMM|nr:hypothetical protein [Providencia burhodogranariea]EKT60735.1 hypothetical protein OOA_11893 [Providencia burhodogranariea DSM 19968]
MIPFSFIFLIGYLYSYQNRVNRHFTVFSQQHVDISLSFKISQLIMIGVLYFIFGALVAIIAPSIGMIVAALGIISFCNALFLKNKILLGVSKANLIITPSIF